MLVLASLSSHYYLTKPSITCQQAAQQLVEILNYARHQAMLRGMTVRVCPSVHGQDCTEDWRQAILVSLQVGATEFVRLHYFPRLNLALELSFKAYPQSQKVYFLANGRTAFQNGTWYYRCQASSTLQRYQVILSQTGSMRIQHSVMR